MFKLNHSGESTSLLLNREQESGLGFKMIHNGLTSFNKWFMLTKRKVNKLRKEIYNTFLGKITMVMSTLYML